MRRFVVLLFALLLSACGFQLRGSYALPWDSIYLGVAENTQLFQQLKRSIEAGSQTRVVTDPQAAQAALVILRDVQGKNILSLNANGLVREFQLTRNFVYRINDAAGKELVPAGQIVLTRDMTFDDAHLFAKESEEAMIRNEMQTDLVQQLLRRLAAAKPKPAS